MRFKKLTNSHFNLLLHVLYKTTERLAIAYLLLKHTKGLLYHSEQYTHRLIILWCQLWWSVFNSNAVWSYTYNISQPCWSRMHLLSRSSSQRCPSSTPSHSYDRLKQHTSLTSRVPYQLATYREQIGVGIWSIFRRQHSCCCNQWWTNTDLSVCWACTDRNSCLLVWSCEHARMNSVTNHCV